MPAQVVLEDVVTERTVKRIQRRCAAPEQAAARIVMHIIVLHDRVVVQSVDLNPLGVASFRDGIYFIKLEYRII